MSWRRRGRGRHEGVSEDYGVANYCRAGRYKAEERAVVVG